MALPADQAAGQGGISTLAFQILGKDAAIGFLNTEHVALGGRPIALATMSSVGEALVRAELERLSSASSLYRGAGHLPRATDQGE